MYKPILSEPDVDPNLLVARRMGVLLIVILGVWGSAIHQLFS